MAKAKSIHGLRIEKKLSAGGQGDTYLVRRESNNEGPFVLKAPKIHGKKSHGRMRREIKALEQLRHPRIPRLIESSESVSPISGEPYILTEYIPGPTLADYVKSMAKGSAFTIREALALASELLDVVEFCQARGFSHRDIKPENIILRNGFVGDPVLIDFGLSCETKEDALTSTEEQIGNRFIEIPELRHSSGDKRDFRTDFTAICGVLFYCVTGSCPRMLVDEHGMKPHRRTSAREVFNNIEPGDRGFLEAIFDKGFDLLDKRFQTASDLRESISPENYEKIGAIQSRLALISRERGSAGSLPDLQRWRAVSQRSKDFVCDVCLKHSNVQRGADLHFLRYCNSSECGSAIKYFVRTHPRDWPK